MALPKLDMPLYTHFFTGLNRKIKYRAFNVREQKILLQAKESKDISDQIDAMKQIVSLCTNGDFDVDQAPFFDIEDLFLRIRMRSVSDVVDISYKVKETGDVVTLNINLEDIKVTIGEGHDKVIKLSDKVGLVMRYPTLTQINEFSKDDTKLIISCIDHIYDGEEIYNSADTSEAELSEWLDDLDTEGLMKIKKFFDTMPRLRYSTEVKYKTKDGEEKAVPVEFEGIDSFFR